MRWVELETIDGTEMWWLLDKGRCWAGGVEHREGGKYAVETNESIHEMECDTLEEAQAYVVVMTRLGD
jgi:hypothetical protein